MAKVSIVAPVYGVEKYIEQFLGSIRAQTFQDLEVILVDDGSPDNCPSILDDFAAQDLRYHVIHQHNGGVSVARNKGLAYATGEYVYIVDSDDWLDEHAIEDLYKEAIRTDADIVYGDWYAESEVESRKSTRWVCFPNAFVADDKESIQVLQCGVLACEGMNLQCKCFDYITHLGGAPWRGLYKMSVIKNNNITFDPYVRGIGDDILFTLHVYEYANKIAYIQRPIYHYRRLTASYTHGYKANYFESLQRTFERFEDFLNEYNKNDTVRSFYYYRVLLYFNQGINRYFLNTNNQKSRSERLSEFKSVLNSVPYNIAMKKAPLDLCRSKKKRLGYMLLRLKLRHLFWMIKEHSVS